MTRAKRLDAICGSGLAFPYPLSGLARGSRWNWTIETKRRRNSQRIASARRQGKAMEADLWSGGSLGCQPPASEISFPSPLLYHLLFLLLPHTLLPTIDASFRHLACRLGRACCNSIREEQNKAYPRRTPTNAIKSNPVRVDRYSTLLAQCFGVSPPLITSSWSRRRLRTHRAYEL